MPVVSPDDYAERWVWMTASEIWSLLRTRKFPEEDSRIIIGGLVKFNDKRWCYYKNDWEFWWQIA